MTSPRSDRYRDTIRQFCVLLAVFAAFGTNVLANIQPIGGLTIGEISKTFFPDVLVVPANYAFIIWSVIYLGLFSLTIYQALPARRQDLELRTIGYGIVAASLAQIIWVYLFQLQQFALSVVAMLAIAAPLALVYQQAQIGCRPVSPQRLWLAHIPVSIYFAWICVATIVNIATTLDYGGWSAWGVSPTLWTIAILAIATVIAIAASWNRFDPAFLAVFIWAFVAIVVRNWTENSPVTIASSVGAIVLVVTMAIAITRHIGSTRDRSATA